MKTLKHAEMVEKGKEVLASTWGTIGNQGWVTKVLVHKPGWVYSLLARKGMYGVGSGSWAHIHTTPLRIFFFRVDLECLSIERTLEGSYVVQGIGRGEVI